MLGFWSMAVNGSTAIAPTSGGVLVSLLKRKRAPEPIKRSAMRMRGIFEFIRISKIIWIEYSIDGRHCGSYTQKS